MQEESLLESKLEHTKKGDTHFDTIRIYTVVSADTHGHLYVYEVYIHVSPRAGYPAENFLMRRSEEETVRKLNSEAKKSKTRLRRDISKKAQCLPVSRIALELSLLVLG